MANSTKSRLIIKDLKVHGKRDEITLLIGARQTGKTTLLKDIQKDLNEQGGTTAFFNLEDKTFLEAFNKHPKNLFQFIPLPVSGNRVTVFIDEIQYLDDPSNFLKLLYDEYVGQLKLIVSGSSSFYIDQKFGDSLAGRKRIFHLPTMNFREFLYFKDFDALKDLVHSGSFPRLYETDLFALLAEYLIWGGYPQVVLAPDPAEKKFRLRELATAYVKKDIQDAVIKHPDAYLNIMQIAAKQIGGLVNPNTIGKNIGLHQMTVEAYLLIMQKSFHISLIPPYFKNTTTELRKMRKVYFQDHGLRNYFINDFSPLPIRDDRGELLENYVFRLFSDHFDDWDIRYWRTQKKLEVDFVIEGKRAYEVKYSAAQFKSGKYQFFKNKYPDIPLELIHYNNVLNFDPMKKY